MQPDSQADAIPDGSRDVRFDHNVLGSTIYAGATDKGQAVAIGVNYGDITLAAPQSVENLASKLRVDPAEAALALAKEPERETRLGAMEQLQPGHIALIVEELASGMTADEVAGILGGLSVAKSGATLGALDSLTAADLLLRMKEKVRKPRLRSLISWNLERGLKLIEMVADQELVKIFGRATPNPGPAVAARLLEEAVGQDAPRLIVGHLRGSSAAAVLLLDLYSRDSAGVVLALTSAPVNSAAAHLSAIARYQLDVAVQMLHRVGVPTAANLLAAYPDQGDAALLVERADPAEATLILARLGPGSGPIVARLHATSAAIFIEVGAPEVGARILSTLPPERRAETLLLIRPRKVHLLLASGAVPVEELPVNRVVVSALRRGPDASDPETGLMWPPLLSAVAAAAGGTRAIAARAAFDRTQLGFAGAIGRAWASTAWMMRAGWAASDVNRGLSKRTVTLRRQRTSFAALFGIAAVVAALSIATSSGSKAKANPGAGATNSSMTADPGSSRPRPSGSTRRSGGVLEPSQDANLDNALPVLRYARDWQQDCPNMSRLPPNNAKVVGLNCTIVDGLAHYAVNFIQYLPVKGPDPLASVRPSATDHFSMLSGGVPQNWTADGNRAGTYLTFLNKDNQPAYWLEDDQSFVAVLVFCLQGDTISDAAALLRRHGYSLSS